MTRFLKLTGLIGSWRRADMCSREEYSVLFNALLPPLDIRRQIHQWAATALPRYYAGKTFRFNHSLHRSIDLI